MRDDAGLERLLRLEAHKLRRSLVTTPRPLARLVREPEPAGATKGGGPHKYDRAALQRLAERFAPLTAYDLRVPVTFDPDREVPADCFAAEANAMAALREPGVAVMQPREERPWPGLALAREFARGCPGCARLVVSGTGAPARRSRGRGRGGRRPGGVYATHIYGV